MESLKKAGGDRPQSPKGQQKTKGTRAHTHYSLHHAAEVKTTAVCIIRSFEFRQAFWMCPWICASSGDTTMELQAEVCTNLLL